ncbi:MAG: helix-turn-helix domain-containing protein [Chloroflexota bacterium]|nr:helix-turn-helix domain-containing protein [Chloroflexota bacterium]
MADRRAQDLEFLLMPQAWEKEAAEAARELGLRFGQLRYARGITGSKAARDIGTTVMRIYMLEKGDISSPGGPFDRYVRYVDYLGLSFQELFVVQN